MLIGVLSDIHDHLQHLERALAVLEQRGVAALVFCGDFCSPIPARVLGKFPAPVHCVFGNGDGDRFQISRLAQGEFPHLVLHGEYAELSLAGAQIAVTHYPFYAQALAMTGRYQAVLSGHTHEWLEQRIGDCLWLNPGEIMGWKGEVTCALYETASAHVEKVALAK